MNLRIARVGNHETLRFAAGELARYLSEMDPKSDVAILSCDHFDGERKDVLWLGWGEAFAGVLPPVKSAKLDDGIFLSVSGGRGVIAGWNPRAALIAVYRLLQENGCFFDRPTGEIVPQKALDSLSAQVCEAPDSRYRVMCIEGAVSEKNVRDMIAWLPKVGMNGYFRQFFVPHEFFQRWYNHENNPLLPKEPVSEADTLGFMNVLEEEIKLRGLEYQAVGHGWTSEAFGVTAGGWDGEQPPVPEKFVPILAQVNGKRELFHGVALNTQLCYSNPVARERLTDAIVAYAQAHPAVDVLHFWLADGQYNHCECEECQKEIPTDFYVRMLNELDEKLAEKGMDTRIIFLAYMDILWTPKHERIRNPDRFILMFAPITRSYTEPFQPGKPYEGTIPAFERNRTKLPTDVKANLAMLKDWQAIFPGECVDFDYHFMWDHLLDAGYYQMARILLEDVERLADLGMSGYISCQLQRTFYPHALGMHMMAQGLWNRQTRFEDAAAQYFRQAFGADGGIVEAYMRDLSAALTPAYLRAELPYVDEALARQFASAEAIVDAFEPVALRNQDHAQPCVRNAWRELLIHTRMVRLLARAMADRASGRFEAGMEGCEALCRYAQASEAALQSDFDAMHFVKCMRAAFSLKDPVLHWLLRRKPLNQ